MKNFLLKKSTNIKLFDLGNHPFADTFISSNNFHINEPVYPLRCFLDKKSGCIFNEVITSDKKRYNLYDYSYTSSNSQYSKNYWKKYADDFKNKYKLKGKILEIGCNDGYLLNLLNKKGFKSFGCDASKFICNLPKNKKSGIMNYIFNLKNSKKIKKTTGKVNFVIANNVVNHSNNPDNFIKGVKSMLDDNGYFIFEQPYWLKMMKSSRIDQIYHEHITYFTIKFAKWILEKNGMYLYDFKVTPYHGGSLRIISKKKKEHKEKNHNKIIKAIQLEEKYGLFNKKIYKIINKKLNRKKILLHKKIKKYKKDGYKIAGIGAAAKANTFLCYFNLDNKIIDFVTDASNFKIGKFTPKTRIPIYSDKILKKYLKVVVIILSWNISNMLKIKLKKLNRNLIFINL
jgi:2-polyprenyl-3-methyl-5-hydroxy-6-metoxy-1,4-benzoquinol methylase